jgi:replicative DNA helicase
MTFPDGDDDRPARPQGATRVPPHNLQAEESLLGAMLLSKDAISAASEILEPENFYKPAHGHIFEAITSLSAAGEPADPVTVADELRRAGLLDAIGGPATLVTLQAATPAISNAARYAKIVEEHALLRRLIGVAGEIAEMGFSLPDDVAKTVDTAESMVFEVAQRRVTDTMAPIHDLLNANLDRLESLYDKGDSITGVPTGFLDLDDLLSGLQPNALLVLGARPSMGKTAFALGLATHAAMEAQRPVLVFSLEMGQLELTQRMLCAEARVDSKRVRNGNLTEADWGKIAHATGRLAEAPIWIDDNPNLTIMEIRSKARRLRSRLGDLGLVVVDYLQLMTGRSNAENRQVEVSEISRGLKILARELECPVLALSQLSRNLEMRADKRPMLADLRESGCLTADTLITRADNGEQVAIGELLALGATDVPVWTLDEHYKLVPGRMTRVFPSGTKETYELRLRSGRSVKASGNHPFLGLGGWTPLDDLVVGDHIAVPRALPNPLAPVEWSADRLILLAHLLGDGCHVERHALQYTTTDHANAEVVAASARAEFSVVPRIVEERSCMQVYLAASERLTHGVRNPIAAWLDELGLWGCRSWQKFVPQEVFGLADDQIATFLHHLWATDGCVWTDPNERRAPVVYYATTSRRLALDVQTLLLRLGIRSRVRDVEQGPHRMGHHVIVQGAADQVRFADVVGVHGERARDLEPLRVWHDARTPNTNLDAIPKEIWDYIRHKSMPEHGVTTRELAQRLGMSYCGSTLYRHGVSRDRMGRLATALPDDTYIRDLASSDVFWDEVVAIEPLGPQEVFDATVDGTHNFLADGIIVHNSIEQDADVVMFIYRDDVYNVDSPDRGTAEILVSKHRNGPTGMVRLAFLDHYTKFANMARGA